MKEITIPLLQDFIAGQFVQPEVELVAWNHNPNTGEPIQRQMATGEALLEKVLHTAWNVHQSGTWANTAVNERIAVLNKMADWLEANPVVLTSQILVTRRMIERGLAL